ncbi:MAG: hypothetical protein ACREED_02530 [Stellaceae bacterium]
MKIDKLANDTLELTLSSHELDGIKNCLNEVWGGFPVQDFESMIGTNRQEVSGLADQMVAVLADENAPPLQPGNEDLPIYVMRILNRKPPGR